MKAALSNWKHPLRDRLFEWAGDRPGLVRFAPQAEFQREVDLVGVVSPALCHEEAKRSIWTTYRHSKVLGRALVGGPPGMAVHELCFAAAQGHYMGLALATAAWLAFDIRHRGMPKVFDGFSCSTTLEGFEDALAAWADFCEFGLEFNGRDQLQYVNRQLVNKEIVGADFWNDRCRDAFPTQKAFNAALDQEMYLADDAERKAREPSRKNKAKKPIKGIPSEVLHVIKWGWVPLSFWARMAKSIPSMLNHQSTDPDAPIKSVRDYISHSGLSPSHKGYEHQPRIDAAENPEKS